MKEEEAIETLAWELASFSEIDHATTVPKDLSALSTAERLSRYPTERAKLLEDADLALEQPPAYIRERILDSVHGPQRKQGLTRYLPQIAAVVLLGLSFMLFPMLRPAETRYLSQHDFDALDFHVSAQGLQEFRSTNVDKPVNLDTTHVQAYSRTPISISIEPDITPQLPLHFAVFQQLGDKWQRLENIQIEQAVGAANITLMPSELQQNANGQHVVQVAVSRDETFEPMLNQFSQANDKQQSDRSFLITIEILPQD